MAVQTIAQRMAPRVYPLLTVAERLAMLRKLQGAWKHRKPDPLEELKEIKKGWDRKLPHLR